MREDMWRLVRTCAFVAAAAGLSSGCDTDATSETAPAGSSDAVPVQVMTAAAAETPIPRYTRVSGTVRAQEEADVAAEVAGRVIATPVERGTAVPAGAVLVRIATGEVAAQLREAEANAAQLEARLGLAAGGELDLDRVPEVANARAALELARSDFERVRMLFEQKLVSRAEFGLRSTQAESARWQHEVARNNAAQQYQALVAAEARVALARKAVDDTVVRAPFAGVVGERVVSVGDYVTRGTKVVSVMRVDPIRVELTVPEQHIAAVAIGRAVTIEVNAYPGRTFTGDVRYVSPGLRADSRVLVIEAVVPNPSGELKPGFFATAMVAQASPRPAVVVPATAVRIVAETARVYVVSGNRVEERIVSTGPAVNQLVEITSGLRGGEIVATTNVAQLTDGGRVVVSR